MLLRSCRSATNTLTRGLAQATAARALEEMPHPPEVPLLKSLPYFLSRGGLARFDRISEELQAEHGPIVLLRVLNERVILLFEPDDFEQVFRQEGRNPRGSLETALTGVMTAFERKGWKDRSLLFTNGESWRHLRQEIQKKLLHPVDAESYLVNFGGTFDQASKLIPKYGDNLSAFIPRITFELTGNLLFDKSLNALENPDPVDEDFMNSMHLALDTQAKMTDQLPIFHEKSIKTISQCLDRMGDRALHHLKEAVKTLEQDPTKNAYIAHLLKDPKLTEHECHVNISTLLMAGVDTTANGVAWLLYHLAKFPRVQDKLREELRRVLGGRNLRPGDLHNLPYLRNAIKESSRLDPVSANLARTLPVDIQLHGYNIPAGIPITMCFSPLLSDPKVFEDPKTMIPERWDEARKAERRASGNFKHDHPFTSLPFSFGPRMCVGARVANLEMAGIAARLVQDYKIGVNPPDQKIERRLAPLTRPNPMPKLSFTPSTS